VKALGAELASLVDSTEASLLKISEQDSAAPIRPGGWSRKQVIGHLIDSASNNHQRFVRAVLQGSLDFRATIRKAASESKPFRKCPGRV
jgi:hypothetical protein